MSYKLCLGEGTFSLLLALPTPLALLWGCFFFRETYSTEAISPKKATKALQWPLQQPRGKSSYS